jgi:hypothetical protein
MLRKNSKETRQQARTRIEKENKKKRLTTRRNINVSTVGRSTTGARIERIVGNPEEGFNGME